jgi:hypothetical protein
MIPATMTMGRTPREPLIKTGRIKLKFKMIKFKARNARNSRAIAKFCNTGIDCFEIKLIVHVLFRGSLVAAGGAESPFRPAGKVEIIDNVELGLDHWHKHHLGDTVSGADSELGGTPIPAGYKQLSLIVRINQAGQISKDDAMFVPHPGSRN